jgi:hypothetical protein
MTRTELNRSEHFPLFEFHGCDNTILKAMAACLLFFVAEQGGSKTNVPDIYS